MTRGCGYCGTPGHSIKHCPERLEAKFGTSADPSPTTVSLREGEKRDDDNTHTTRTQKQLEIAEKEGIDDE